MHDDSSEHGRQFITPIILTVLTIILGFISFHSVFPDYPLSRKLYYTFQLFSLESGDRFYENGVQPLWVIITFNLARFLAVATLVVTIVLAILSVLKYKFFKLKVRFMKGHTILCGLGDIGKAIADNIKDKKKLIIVEKDTSNEEILRLRKKGARIIDANALDITVLDKLGIEHADCLFAITGDDFDNLAIINHAKDIIKGNDIPADVVKLVANIGSRNLKNAVVEEWRTNAGDSDCRLRKLLNEFFKSTEILKNKPGDKQSIEPYELSKKALTEYKPSDERSAPGLENIIMFNINQMAGKFIFMHYPPDRFRNITHADIPPMKILIIGFSNIGEEVLKLCFQSCHYINRKSTRITVVSYDGDVVEGWIRSKFRNLETLFDIKVIKQNPHHMTYKFLTENELGDVDVIYICSSEDRYQASYSSRVRDLFGNKVPIIRPFYKKDVLCKEENCRNTYSFNIFSKVAIKQNIINQVSDQKAIAVHNRWIKIAIGEYIRKVENCIKDGERIPVPKPTLVPWNMVSEEIREDNRSVIDHINVKLRSVDQLRTPEDYDNPGKAGIDFEFLNEKNENNKIEQLAETEHRRWMANKFLCGWTYGEQRDDSKKKHDCLKDYSELPDDIKQYDRQQVREMQDIINL